MAKAAVRATILLVDDEHDMLELLKMRLEAEGYRVLTAADGTTGLSLAEASNPDLIILDIMMPGMDGFETLEKLKAGGATKGTPVLMLSAGAKEEEWAKKGLRLGSVGYVVKPFETESLLFTLEQCLRKEGGKR